MMVPSSAEATPASLPGEEVQSYEEPDAPVLELPPTGEELALDWQPELDSALEAIDSCLPVKRRRSTDPPGTPPFPRREISVLTFTPEILDALASRVADKLKTVDPAARPAAEAPRMRSGTVISIRYRWPLFSLPFTRRSRRSRARG